MKNERRTETHDAGSGRPANARIHDPIRAFKKEFVRECLWGAVILRNWIGLQAALPFSVVKCVKLARKIGQEFHVIECVLPLDATVGRRLRAIVVITPRKHCSIMFLLVSPG